MARCERRAPGGGGLGSTVGMNATVVSDGKNNGHKKASVIAGLVIVIVL